MKQFYNPENPVFESKPLMLLNSEHGYKPVRVVVFAAIFLLLAVLSAKAQLGVYEFTGAGACPNQNPSVSVQPANAVFSNFSTVNATCSAATDQNASKGWNDKAPVNVNQYHEFSITSDPNYVLNLTSLSFTESVSENGSGSGNGNTAWVLRSSINGYSTNIATGSAYDVAQTPNVALPSGSFSGLSTVTFRLYLTNARDNSTLWTIDDVTVNGIVALVPADPANPTSNSPQCSSSGVTLTANGVPSAGETWYWQTTPTGTSTANSGSTYTVTTSGTYYIRSQDNTTLAWSAGAGSVSVVVTPDVSVPVFSLGSASTRCQGIETITYSATAANSTDINYSLDAASLAAGNTIDPSTGQVTYVAGWSGTSVITATANGCNGPKTATHTVTITPGAGLPVFNLGSSSTRCQGSGSVTYTATATNSTGITYSLDAASITGGNSINASTGKVTYANGWSGTSIITATATGCNGSVSSSAHTVTVTPTVGTPAFALGASSTRCLGSSAIIYEATATNATDITYSLDLASRLGGNTINASTGEVTFSPIWVGSSTITATANGCNGPKTATHVVTITAAVSTPVFVAGSSSTRCQAAGTVTYTANAANSSGITYSLDDASLAGGNTINSITGAVSYAAGWSGTSIITASAAGCNGPKTATHTVTTTGLVTAPIFVLRSTSTRCQGAGSITYSAAALNATGIVYSLDAASIAGGNSINSSTGKVTYVAGWSGTSTITASASGCGGPKTSTHVVTTTPTVGTPVFLLGSSSARCQGAGSVTYTANATNATDLSYSLDASSLAGGNSINSSTGEVTYAAGWSGTSTITVTANGCNGPKTATHTVTVTPSVGVPVFSSGTASTRLQGAATVTYSATASNTTGITYSLDAASLAGGNTINASTGIVTYSANWTGTSIITASAAGCNGPQTATHTVTVNANSVIKQLYLSDPSQALDRVDPVNTADATTATTAILSSAGTTFTTFTMSSALCSDLIIKAGTITVKTYVAISSGSMPANPNITALLRYGATNIITLSNPVYSGGLLTWTATLASDVTVPVGQAIALRITTAQAGVTFTVNYDSQTKPSRVELPVSTFINVTSLNVYTAAYPGATTVVSGVSGSTKYIRAAVTDPFGTSDITAVNFKITPTGSIVSGTSINTSGCTNTFEYAWTVPATGGTYSISAIAKEGYENTVTNSKNMSFDVCSACAPVAVNDSASGTGGNPLVIDALANDYDPNNNINPSSITITVPPSNGSAYVSSDKIIYLPNGVFSGSDTLTYQVCDLTSPTPLCATAQVILNIDPLIIDICGDASKTHTYYIPYPEDQAYKALVASGSPSIPSNNIRTVISIKVPYAGMKIYWDEWEDGYETNILNPTQSTTKVWGDGNPYNGIAPGYPSDIIPAGGSIILDNTMPANPRNSANIYYDGKDKVVSNGQLALTQVSGEPSIMSVQSIKTNVTSTYDFGQSFTIPLGENFPSRDFRYTSLFIRASENNTTVNIDKDNDGVFETTTTLNEGQSYFLNGGVQVGATVASDKPVGVELHAGGVDNYSVRNAPIYPATWYGNTYYTPVPTSDNAADNPKDTSAVMFYNSLSRPININWYSGAPANGVITVPAKSAVRFPLAYSATATYKFVNLTGESFTAIEMVNSYSPDGSGTSGSAYDWAFNLLSEARLSDYTTVAWAPGGLDLDSDGKPDVNGNPIWVTPDINTTIYVKYDGDISGTSGSISPCGLRYDVSYNVNALNYIKIKDNSDNDQGGMAIYTCNGAKIAAAYGEDPKGSTAGNSAYWDVGTTIQPFCKEKLVVATDDYATTLVNQPVTITVLDNDFGFLATIDPATVTNLGLLQAKHGTVTVNANGTILYKPNSGYVGLDSFEYNVCSTPSPIVCDIALVVVNISSCGATGNLNIISGQVFIDKNKDGVNNDGGTGFSGGKVYLYVDGNCNGAINTNELVDSVTVDSSGYYQFTRYPEKVVSDDFKTGSSSSCASGSDGDAAWATNWTDAGDASTGFCTGSGTADVEIIKDGAFGYSLRLKDSDVSATRRVNLSGASKAFLTFSYRKAGTSISSFESIYVQVSTNGTTWNTIYTITGDGTTDANYVTVYNQDITSYASSTTYIRFVTNGNFDDDDIVYIGSVSIRYLKYPLCYITQLASSSVPGSYYTTTPTMQTLSISSSATCTSQIDFGLTKTSITISGTLHNDKNALMDGMVNGAAIGKPGGTTMYAYLADSLGSVVFKTTVNSVNGSYSFSLADVNTTYSLVVSASDVAVLSPVPNTLNLASPWNVVDGSYGTNNLAGSGNLSITSNPSITVKTGTSNVTNVDFGIEQLPNSDDYIKAINQPVMDQMIMLNGAGINPPVLSGSDPEDYASGGVLTSKTVIIDTVPANAELYYNGTLITNGQKITNFNSNLFAMKITDATAGTTSLVFNYSYVDEADMKDLTPATYTLIWLTPLPVDGLKASATLENTVTTIKWSTISEQNTSHYVVERSIDGINFASTGNSVPAAGNSNEKREYQLKDDITGLMQNSVIYYRVKLFDIDGQIKYSNIVSVRPAQKSEVKMWPNPFRSSVSISFKTETATTLNIKLIDLSGRVVKNMLQPVSKGVSQISLDGLQQLSAGIYMLEVTDEKNKNSTIQKMVKN